VRSSALDSMHDLFGFPQNSFNFFVLFRSMSIIIKKNYSLSFLKPIHPLKPLFLFSCNVLLYLVHDIQLFKILLYYRGNEMQNLGYHFC